MPRAPSVALLTVSPRKRRTSMRSLSSTTDRTTAPRRSSASTGSRSHFLSSRTEAIPQFRGTSAFSVRRTTSSRFLTRTTCGYPENSAPRSLQSHPIPLWAWCARTPYARSSPRYSHGLATLAPPRSGGFWRCAPAAHGRQFCDHFERASVTKAALEEAGPFCPGRGGAEDYGLWLRFAEVCRFAYLEEPWLIYRDCGLSYRQGMVRGGDRSTLFSDLDRLEERFPGISKKYPREFSARRSELYGISDAVASPTATDELRFSHSRRHFGSEPTHLGSWRRLVRAPASSDATSGTHQMTRSCIDTAQIGAGWPIEAA